MLNVNKGGGGLSPPLYKGNLGVRQTELTIFVFANGEASICNQAKKFELCKFDLLAWNPTLDTIATRMGVRKKGIKALYTPSGKRINGYWELMDGGCYVGVGPHERFRKLDYFDPSCELFKSKIKTRNPIDKENEVKALTRETAPFFCSTSTPILHPIHDTAEDHHMDAVDSPFPHSSKRNSTRPPQKPSKSVEELRRIYNTGNTQRSRRVLTSSIPYYKKGNPTENGRKNYATGTRSCSLNLPGENTDTQIRNFSSKYVPYYTKLQQKFLNQAHGKRTNPPNNGQKKSLPAVKIVPRKTAKPVNINSVATNASSHSIAALTSNAPRIIHTNTPATNASSHSIAALTANAPRIHTNTPVTNASSHSIAALTANAPRIIHSNTPATNASSHSIAALTANAPRIIHTNTPVTNASLQGVATLTSDAPQIIHTNTPVTNVCMHSTATIVSVIYTNASASNLSSDSSAAHISDTSWVIHTNTPETDVSLHSSGAHISETPAITHVNIPMNAPPQSSVQVPPETYRTAHTQGYVARSNPLKRPREVYRKIIPTENSSLTCVKIHKPEPPKKVEGPVKSLPYFLDLGVEADILDEWEAESSVARDESPPSDESLHSDESPPSDESLHSDESLLSDDDSNGQSAQEEMIDSDCSESNSKMAESRKHQSGISWPNDRPWTGSTERPEETEDTQVDYWFMSEYEFEDDSSDDMEEGGLKMKFLELD